MHLYLWFMALVNLCIPCGDFLKSFPGGAIVQAGLGSVKGRDNVIVHCPALVQAD